jgi:hypothetical protein
LLSPKWAAVSTIPTFEMDALNRGRNSLIAASALVLFAILYYSLIFRYGLNLADEGNVALISQRLMHGERPFLDVAPGYNVLWFYPISTLFRIFGTNLLLMRAYFYAISTGSGLIAFFLLRRLDAPLWLAFLQGAIVISINGQYFKAYIPFLILSNLFAITLFLTSQRKALLSLGAGVLLGTTFLTRIDIGIFLSFVWFSVILLHAFLLHPRLSLNLIVLGNLVLGVVAMHLPFIYDAYHRRFLPAFESQYSSVAILILNPLLPHKSQPPAEPERPTESLQGPPAATIREPTLPTRVSKSPTLLQRRSFREIFLKSPSIEKRLMAFLTYAPVFLICALLIMGLSVCLSKRMAIDRWLLFSALLAGCLSAFPQFFLFRPDLPHLIEFLNGGLVALTCAGWLLWSSKGRDRVSVSAAVAIAIVGLCYLSLTFPNPYGGTLFQRINRHTEFRGANGVDVILSRKEYEEVNTLFSATVLNSTKKDYVVCYPYLPGVNFITARPTFQNNLYIDNAVQSPGWQEAEIAKIQRYRPAVVIIDDWKINGTEESRFSNWAALMTKFIESRYRQVAATNNKRIFALLTPSM